MPKACTYGPLAECYGTVPHSRELQGADGQELGPHVCTQLWNFLRPPSPPISPILSCLHSGLSSSFSSCLLRALSLVYRPEKCRRRGAGRLVLEHCEAASLGATRGGPSERGRRRRRQNSGPVLASVRALSESRRRRDASIGRSPLVRRNPPGQAPPVFCPFGRCPHHSSVSTRYTTGPFSRRSSFAGQHLRT